MLWRPQVSQKCGHLVERSPSHGLVLTSRREVVADLFLMVPQKSVEGQHIGITDKGHGVGLVTLTSLNSVAAVRRDLGT